MISNLVEGFEIIKPILIFTYQFLFICETQKIQIVNVVHTYMSWEHKNIEKSIRTFGGVHVLWEFMIPMNSLSFCCAGIL